MKLLFSTFLIIATFHISAEEADQSITPSFLTTEQKHNFYNLMVAEIERLDAEIIETRNHAKTVKWKQFKQHYKHKFETAADWDQLSLAFSHFSQGLVNLHTRTKFHAHKRQPSKKGWLNDKVLFEYPNKKFYLASNKAQITHLNNTPILEAYNEYNNYRCRHNNEAGCVDMFSVYLQAGAIKVNGNSVEQFKIVHSDGQAANHPLEFSADPEPQADPMQTNFCETHKGYQSFKLTYAGNNLCLYQNQSAAVIPIRHFINPDHDAANIYCEDSENVSNLCRDIQEVLLQLHDSKPKHLIFDVAQNFGGNENTSLLAAFMPNSFSDLPVMYRNTTIMSDKEKRRGLFWGNSTGEAWYQSVKGHQGDYFPIRGDFCRGVNGCHLSMIKPHPKAYTAEKISLITDWMCVSSCDDFAWRMSQFAGAKLYGITPAQDATYARVKLYLYIDPKGQIKSNVTSEAHEFTVGDNSLILAELKIPYSKTVTLDGELKNIQTPNITEVAYTLNNHDNYSQAVLEKILH